MNVDYGNSRYQYNPIDNQPVTADALAFLERLTGGPLNVARNAVGGGFIDTLFELDYIDISTADNGDPNANLIDLTPKGRQFLRDIGKSTGNPQVKMVIGGMVQTVSTPENQKRYIDIREAMEDPELLPILKEIVRVGKLMVPYNTPLYENMRLLAQSDIITDAELNNPYDQFSVNAEQADEIRAWFDLGYGKAVSTPETPVKPPVTESTKSYPGLTQSASYLLDQLFQQTVKNRGVWVEPGSYDEQGMIELYTSGLAVQRPEVPDPTNSGKQFWQATQDGLAIIYGTGKSVKMVVGGMVQKVSSLPTGVPNVHDAMLILAYEAPTGSRYDASQVVFNAVRPLCKTETDGLLNWLLSEDWTGNETVYQIAAEWDNTNPFKATKDPEPTKSINGQDFISRNSAMVPIILMAGNRGGSLPASSNSDQNVRNAAYDGYLELMDGVYVLTPLGVDAYVAINEVLHPDNGKSVKMVIGGMVQTIPVEKATEKHQKALSSEEQAILDAVHNGVNNRNDLDGDPEIIQQLIDNGYLAVGTFDPDTITVTYQGEMERNDPEDFKTTKTPPETKNIRNMDSEWMDLVAASGNHLLIRANDEYADRYWGYAKLGMVEVIQSTPTLNQWGQTVYDRVYRLTPKGENYLTPVPGDDFSWRNGS